MGQTLTHGVYLPDEGERNCYSGLAGNWTILDNSVGTIAEHTTALAGKAPAVHTHTKSDVTDLLNSNFIPSANNSYDLGSSSYQWNNVYSKGYYYNGTPWGLDKENTWTDTNTFSAVSYGEKIRLKNTGLDLSSGNPSLSSTYQHMIWWNDKNNTPYAKVQAWANDKNSTIILTSYYREDANTVRTSNLRNQCEASSKAFFPDSNSDTDLGTSTNKWKSLNGINPGALSLPDIYNSYDVITTNWSTAYNQPNDLKINGANPTYPGWLFIRLDNCTAADDFVIVRYYHVSAGNLTFFGSFIPAASSYVLSVPIQAGITTKVWVSKIPTTCKYYACLGTVK